MASVTRQQPTEVDYFSLNTEKSQNTAALSPSESWDSSYPYNEPVLLSSDSCDSTLPSPTSPASLALLESPYALPKEGSNSDIKSEQAFNFGSFEDWMRWDDPSDAALSPTSDFFPTLKVETLSPTMNNFELSNSNDRTINPSDNYAVFEDSMNDEPLFQTPSASLVSSPPREGLYSTPLSWTRPAVSSRRSASFASVLSPQQEFKLRDIAMPSHSRSQSHSVYPASPESASSHEQCQDNRRKRKNSMDDEDEDDNSPPPPSNSRHPPVKKTAHNMIEKRYRTNLNDKIAALRDSVPSLRVMSKKNSRGKDIEEDLQGLTPAHKLNKATVLSKATEYIAHLEKRNKYLNKENAALKSRVDAFEILIMSRQNPTAAQMAKQQQQAQLAQQQVQQQMQQQRIAMNNINMPGRGFRGDGTM